MCQDNQINAELYALTRSDWPEVWDTLRVPVHNSPWLLQGPAVHFSRRHAFIRATKRGLADTFKNYISYMGPWAQTHKIPW